MQSILVCNVLLMYTRIIYTIVSGIVGHFHHNFLLTLGWMGVIVLTFCVCVCVSVCLVNTAEQTAIQVKVICQGHQVQKRLPNGRPSRRWLRICFSFYWKLPIHWCYIRWHQHMPISFSVTVMHVALWFSVALHGTSPKYWPGFPIGNHGIYPMFNFQ